MIALLHRRFLPRAVFCLYEAGGKIEKLPPFVKAQGARGWQAGRLCVRKLRLHGSGHFSGGACEIAALIGYCYPLRLLQTKGAAPNGRQDHRKEPAMQATNEAFEPTIEREPTPEDLKKAKTEFWDKMRKFAGKVPFSKDVVSLYYFINRSRRGPHPKGCGYFRAALFHQPNRCRA